MAETDDERSRECARIAEQNDAFRKRRPGGGQGQWVCTRAVNEEGPDFIQACVASVSDYDDFTEDNDPFGTHEMGFMDIMGHKVCFKIDLYDETYQYGTPAPADLSKTRRVLTILFLSDY